MTDKDIIMEIISPSGRKLQLYGDARFYGLDTEGYNKRKELQSEMVREFMQSEEEYVRG